MANINPNKRRSKVESYSQLDLEGQKKLFPSFVTELHIHQFRHLKDLTIKFNTPITVLTGSNRTGKSSIFLCLGGSHFNFLTRNATSGEYERTRWGNVMRFTSSDIQTDDWSYTIKSRENGSDDFPHKGSRKLATKSWSGVAKKEGQIGHPAPHVDVSPNGRNVMLIDMERIIPGRHQPVSIYTKVKAARGKKINRKVRLYLSYILENNYSLSELGGIGERRVFSYSNSHNYSSFNTASGEDVLTRLLIDIVGAKPESLILIEEIEIGLHPMIQRRLIDILFCESSETKKQFIITTHSPSIISSVKPEARILLQKQPNDSIIVRESMSVCGALNCMDSESYPLLSIYVEDDISHRLVQEAIQLALPANPGLRKLVRIVEVGSADKTYRVFKALQTIDIADSINRGYACILDGDKRNEKFAADGSHQFPLEDGLFFHFSNEAPERMLLREFLKANPNATLQYHADDGNAHNLMQKIVDEGFCASPQMALEKCIEELKKNPDGLAYFQNMAAFILNRCEAFATSM